MAAKVGQVVTDGRGTPTSKPRDLLIAWSRDKWKKTYICTSTISIATKLCRVVTYVRKTPFTKLLNPLRTLSHDKWKMLWLSFHNNYSLQIWWSRNFRLEDRTCQIMWSFDYVATWKIKNLISELQQHLWQSKVGWGAPSTKSRERLSKCSCGHYFLNIYNVIWVK